MISAQRNTAYLGVPSSPNGAGILVLHAWWGLNEFTRGFCDRLAQEGFVALAPDLFGGKMARTPEEAEQLVNQLEEQQTVPPVILAAVEELSAHPALNGRELGVIGFSFGAYWALWLAQQQPETVRAVSLFYGTDGGEGDFSASQAAFQGHFAADDPFEPPEGIRALEQNLAGAGRPVEFHTYAGSGHWFFESDRPEAYQPQAAAQAWQRTVDFLRRYLHGQPGE